MKKRMIFIAAMLVALIAAMCFVGCQQELSADEAREKLSASIESAKQQSGYFVKVKTVYAGDNTEEFRLYVKGLEDGDVSAVWDHTIDKIVSTETDYLYWGTASKKGDEDTVKTGLLTADGEDWIIDDAVSLQDFLADERVAPYTIESICAYVEGLTAEQLKITSAKTIGVVDYIYVESVTAESSPLYGCKDIEIRITRERLSNIYYTNTEGKSVQVNIVYGEGRVLDLPQWK